MGVPIKPVRYLTSPIKLGHAVHHGFCCLSEGAPCDSILTALAIGLRIRSVIVISDGLVQAGQS